MNKFEWRKYVKKTLIDRELTMKQLADMCDYSYDAIRKTINLQPPYDQLRYDKPRKAIAEVLGIEVWE